MTPLRAEPAQLLQLRLDSQQRRHAAQSINGPPGTHALASTLIRSAN
jgi:hypothetical protein